MRKHTGEDGGDASNSRLTMVNPLPRIRHVPFATRFFTNLEFGYAGYMPATTTLKGQFTLAGNNLLLPGNTANPFTAAAPGGPGGVLIPATLGLANLNPVGLSRIWGTAGTGIYRSYRVRACTLKITAQPQNGIDMAFVTVQPYHGVLLTDYQQLQSAPFNKSKLVSFGSGPKDNTITVHIPWHKLLGYTEAQYIADTTFASLDGTAPTSNCFWNIFINDSTNSQFNNNFVLQLSLIYHVEFFDVNPIMNDV